MDPENKFAIMECGCSAQGFQITNEGRRKYKCLTHRRDIAMEPQPDLSARAATCTHCKASCKSSPYLAFFQYRPWEPTDKYYCGCRGWN